MAFNGGFATGPSPRGSLGPGARQVKTKTKSNFQGQSVLSVLRHGASPPSPYMPAKQDTNPHSNNGQDHSCPHKGKELVCSSVASSAVAPSSGASSAPSTYIGPGPRGDKGGPSFASSTTSPHGTRHPASSSWMLGGRGPISNSYPISISNPCQKASSCISDILRGIGTSHRGGISRTL